MNHTWAAAAFPSVIGGPGSESTNRVCGIGHCAAARNASAAGSDSRFGSGRILFRNPAHDAGAGRMSRQSLSATPRHPVMTTPGGLRFGVPRKLIAEAHVVEMARRASFSADFLPNLGMVVICRVDEGGPEHGRRVAHDKVGTHP